MKTLPDWLGRLASVRVGLGGKNWDQVVPIVRGGRGTFFGVCMIVDEGGMMGEVGDYKDVG